MPASLTATMRFARRALPVLALAAVLPFLSGNKAYAASPAESFVAQNVQRGFNILSSHGPQRREQFRTFLTNLTDIRRIALFTLGPARRTASPADVDAFVQAFNQFAVAVYESRLSQFAGQTLKVTGSAPGPQSDTIVHTMMIDPNPQPGSQPLNVDFRVRDENGRMVVIDVGIAGIWLGIEERDQFTSFLDEHHGDMHALIAHLDELTRQLRSGQSAPQR